MVFQSDLKGRLSGKVAVISGSGSGIGRETSLVFSMEGAKVAVIDINPTDGFQTVELIKKSGGEGIFVKANITDEADVKAAINAVTDEYKRLDILVNNAGIFANGDVIQSSLEDWNRIMNVNLTGSFLLMKYCIPKMMEGGRGSVVNVSSEAGVVGIGNQVAYNVSKSGVIALTKSSALDFALRNVRINCICPGRCLTPLVQNIIDQSQNPGAKLRELSDDRPVKRMGGPGEIAAAILFLASDEASYATGAILSVDGGYTAQ